LAVIIALDQFSQLLAALYPFHLDQAPWRFGAIALAIGRTTGIVLADSLFVLALLSLDARQSIRLWAVVHLAGAAVLALLLTLFTFDALETVATMRPDLELSFRLAWARPAIVGALVVVAWIWAGILGMRGTAKARHRRRAAEDALIPSA
jgi:hypothetical protein